MEDKKESEKNSDIVEKVAEDISKEDADSHVPTKKDIEETLNESKTDPKKEDKPKEESRNTDKEKEKDSAPKGVPTSAHAGVPTSEDAGENEGAPTGVPTSENEGEQICETFEVTDKSGEHEVVACNTVPKKHAEKKEIAAHNVILRNILIVLAVVIIGFIAWMIFLDFIGTVKYEGLPFEVVSQGDLIFYKHVVPLYDGDTHYANYNFFLRKNPYNTGEIPFDGELNIRNFVAINSTEFTCEGRGIIAIANLVKPFEVAGIEVVHDPNASCDEESRYMLLHIFQGEENKIVQTGEACYDMIVKDCDILDVTEKMMIEMFVLLKEANDKMENDSPSIETESTL